MTFNQFQIFIYVFYISMYDIYTLIYSEHRLQWGQLQYNCTPVRVRVPGTGFVYLLDYRYFWYCVDTTSIDVHPTRTSANDDAIPLIRRPWLSLRRPRNVVVTTVVVPTHGDTLAPSDRTRRRRSLQLWTTHFVIMRIEDESIQTVGIWNHLRCIWIIP